MFSTRGAKILDGTPNYLVIEEIGEIDSVKHFEEILDELKKHIVEKEIRSVSIILNEQQAECASYRELLEEFSFQQQDIQLFYRKDLSGFEDVEIEAQLSIKSLEEATSDVFLETWIQASTGSLNASAPFTSLSAQEEFEGMQSELGTDYQKSCLVVFHEDQAIGVTIPQIEQGTVDEGRLFYFGIVPSFRGKGLGESIHKLSLHLLKQMGATYYIGATGQHNIPMQRIFEANECKLIERKFIYRLKTRVK